MGNRTSRKVEIYDLTTEKLVRTLSVADTTQLAWHPDGQILAVAGSDDKSIHILEVSTGQEHATLRGHQAPVWSLAFAADGLLMSTSWDGTVRLWNITSGQEIFRLAGTFNHWSRDGRRLAVRVDHNVQVWERADTKCIWWIRSNRPHAPKKHRATSIAPPRNTARPSPVTAG